MWSSGRAFVRGCFAVSLAAMLASCRQSVELAPLANLARTADEQEPVFARLAADFALSCRRQHEWRDASAQTLRVDGAPRGGMALVADPEPQASGDACRTDADAARQWQAVNLVVLDYVRGIGHLAGGDPTAADAYGISTLSRSLGTAGVFNAARAGAIGAAASSLVTDAFDVKRRDRIAEIVPRAQAAFETLVDSLESVANVDYRGLLRLERNDANHFFRDGFHARPGGMSPLETLQYRRAWKDELDKIDARDDAVDAYVATLEDLKATHRELIERIRNNDASSVANIVATYVSQYRPKLASIARPDAGPAAP